MQRKLVNGLVRDSLANMAINTAQRIQRRRNNKGKKQLISVNLATVRRRQGGIGRNGPIQPRVAVKTVAANIGTAVSNLQTSVPVVSNGSENLGQMQTGTVANAFAVIADHSLNPAEPGLAPMLAATANQFQRFNTRVLKLTYTPVASTAQNGTIYIAVYPDPQAPLPKSIEDMTATGNMRQWPIYGQPNTWTIPADSIQAAYKVQTVEVKKDANTDTTMNSSGKVVCATMGAAANLIVGTLTWTYSYQLTLKKLATGANDLYGHYTLDARGGNPLPIAVEDLLDGWHVLQTTDIPGDFKLRIRQASHLIVVRLVGDATPYDSHLYTSPDGITYTEVTAMFATVTDTNTTETIYKIPPIAYVRIHAHGAAPVLSGGEIIAVSLRG